MDKYVSENMLYSLMSSQNVLLFCPPWPSMRRNARQKSLYTGLIYRFGFRRLDIEDGVSPSLNSRWADLSVYHNDILPMEELCIIHMPQPPAIVTYIDVLHKKTLRIHSFLHIPNIPVTSSNSYTPFPELEKDMLITNEASVTPMCFDIARAVESDVAIHVGKHIDNLADTSPETVFPLQGTLDGYYWKSIGQWLAVEPRLKQFNGNDHVFRLAEVVLQMRRAVLDCFCQDAEATDTVCEVFFCTSVSSLPRNTRNLPVLSLADMQAVVNDANESLTIKAFMSTNVASEKEYYTEEFHPLETLVSDPWLLFALRTFLPADSSLFGLLQKSQKLQPIHNAVVFTVRDTFMKGGGAEYMRLWTETTVDITTENSGNEGIPLVRITSPLVVQIDRDGTLGRRVKECGGIAFTHGQNQHTTTILLTRDTAYTYNDTLPFLIKSTHWNKSKLGSMLAKPMQTLQHLLVDSHLFRDECRKDIL